MIQAISAGLIAVLVGFCSSAILVFQAASSAGANAAQASSWIFAVTAGSGITSIILSYRYRKPVLIAWSTAGAALLITSLVGMPMEDAIGAFIFNGLLVTLFGVTGWFEKLMNRIPLSLANAMLAGVLLKFGLDIFVSLKTKAVLILGMLISYLAVKRISPRYAVIAVLIAGLIIAGAQGLFHFESVSGLFIKPVFTMPHFSFKACLGVGLPLFLVTMASQNMTGVAVIKSCGYSIPISPLITATGIATVFLAPFGGFAINLAAITAAICMGKEAHDDPKERYIASIAAGVFYCLIALFGALIATLFAAFPTELIAGLAGIALLGTLGNSLSGALTDEKHRESSLVTFLITASGVSLFGINSAFWGLVGGALVMFAFMKRR